MTIRILPQLRWAAARSPTFGPNVAGASDFGHSGKSLSSGLARFVALSDEGSPSEGTRVNVVHVADDFDGVNAAISHFTLAQHGK